MNFFLYLRLSLIIILLSCFNFLFAENDTISFDTLNIIGSQKIPAKFFRERYLHNDVEQYLDNYQEFVIYQTETVGDVSKPNPYTFSILGNSYRWNKYYVNNFRIDDHYFTGSALHKVQAINFSLNLDIWNTSLGFISDPTSPSILEFAYNHGGNLGGVGPGTENLVHMFHRTAREALYIPINEQRRIKHAYNLYVSDNININGTKYKQNMSFTSSSRLFPDFDYKGITKFNTENYNLVNLNGMLPTVNNNLFTESNYLISINQRDNMFSEFYYNSQETSRLNTINLTLFGSNIADINKTFSSGINVSYKNIRHNNINFIRNVVDQDGEGFEPWYPDADVMELSYALYNEKSINRKIRLKTDLYNSIICFMPTIESFFNPVYYQSTDTSFNSLYVYEWKSKAFNTGILENTIGIEYQLIDNKKIRFTVQPDISFDAMILSEKSLYKINWQADARALYMPHKIIQIAVIAGKKRVPFNFEQARYISDNYLNADIFFWNDLNNDHNYQANEKSDLFSTTGGYYHDINKDIKQIGYYYFDLPVKIKLGNHNFVFHGFYRQYINTWQTYLAEPEYEKGFLINPDTLNVFLQNSGVSNYRVTNIEEYRITQATGINSFLFNNPFSVGYSLKYQYNTKRWLVSFSWAAYAVSGHGVIGSGPLHNDVAALSETTANPNRYINYYGRLDSDRAYIYRFILTHKFSEKFSLVLQIKYKDGQAFTDYDTYLYTEGQNTQIAIWENNVKGDNFINGQRGARKDAFFNTVLRAEYKCKIMNNNFAFNLSVYNIYDFGTELAEYTFKPIRDEGRFVLELNTPRGILIAVKYLF